MSGAGYLAVFEADQLHALALLFLNAYEYVALIWGAFFGLTNLLLGYLVYKSGFLPWVIGILLLLTGAGYLIDSFGNFLLPNTTLSMPRLCSGWRCWVSCLSPSGC